MLEYIIKSYKEAAEYENGNTIIFIVGLIGILGSGVLTSIAFINFDYNPNVFRSIIIGISMSTVPVIWHYIKEKGNA